MICLVKYLYKYNHIYSDVKCEVCKLCPTHLTLRGDSPALAAGQVIPAAGHALGQLGDVGGAHLGQAADLAHRYVVSAEGVA